MTTTISIRSYTEAELASLKGFRPIGKGAVLDALRKAEVAKNPTAETSQQSEEEQEKPQKESG